MSDHTVVTSLMFVYMSENLRILRVPPFTENDGEY